MSSPERLLRPCESEHADRQPGHQEQVPGPVSPGTHRERSVASGPRLGFLPIFHTRIFRADTENLVRGLS